MKKYEVSETFIKEAFEAACETWKGKIKKEFPELFEVKLEVGKWYTNKKLGKSVFCVTKIKDKKVYAFGLDYLGCWKEEEEWTDYESHPSRELATKEEIETMLWKEAEKRGIGKDTKIVRSLTQIGDKCINDGLMIIGYSIDSDELWNKNGCIYKQGKWSTPLNENKEIQNKIDSLQKQLDELKLKVK